MILGKIETSLHKRYSLIIVNRRTALATLSSLYWILELTRMTLAQYRRRRILWVNLPRYTLLLASFTFLVYVLITHFGGESIFSTLLISGTAAAVGFAIVFQRLWYYGFDPLGAAAGYYNVKAHAGTLYVWNGRVSIEIPIKEITGVRIYDMFDWDMPNEYMYDYYWIMSRGKGAIRVPCDAMDDEIRGILIDQVKEFEVVELSK